MVVPCHAHLCFMNNKFSPSFPLGKKKIKSIKLLKLKILKLTSLLNVIASSILFLHILHSDFLEFLLNYLRDSQLLIAVGIHLLCISSFSFNV